MQKSRVLWISALLIFLGFAGAFFYENSYDEEKPLEFYLEARYPEALKSLEINKGGFTTADYLLQKSYLLRQLGHNEDAKECLMAIVNSSLDNPGLHFLSEAYLNLMLSAYLERDFSEMNQHLRNAQRFSLERDEWILLFMGMSFYHDRDFEKALTAFASSRNPGYQSPWMEKRFSPIFSSSWYATHLIHCHIELGNLSEARKMLAENRAVFFPEYVNEYYYLSGLAYLIESQTKSHDLAIPFYRQAIGYLNKMDHAGLKEELQTRLAKGMRGHAQAILRIRSNFSIVSDGDQVSQDTDRDDLSFLPFYIQNLEEWGTKDQIAEVKEQLIRIFDNDSWHGEEKVFDVVSLLLEDSTLRNEMRLRFENLLEKALQKDRAEFLQAYWKGILAFSEEGKIPYGKFSDKVIQKALKSIIKDDVELSKTGQYLDFYVLVEDSPDESFQFAKHLVLIAEQLWDIPQEREKAINLIRAAKKAAPNSRLNDLEQELESYFSYRYSNAIQQDLMPELFDLLFAVETFELASVDIHNKQEIEQQINDAQYLYQQGRLKEAEAKAEWILKMDPGNQKIRQLLGMIAYYYADYGEAKGLLEGTEPQNDEMKEAYAVIAILNGQEQKGIKWIEEVKQHRPIESFVYSRIVYGMLEAGKPFQALEWLENLPEDDPNRIAARIFASYQMNSWQEVINFFELLPPPYANLDGYHGLVIDSLIALGDEKMAEKYLNRLLKRPPEPEMNQLPPFFQSFKKNQLDQWNRFFVAGSFYKNVKNQLDDALTFFNKIENPTVFAKIEKAEVYYRLGKFFDAKEWLLSINRENGGQEGVKQQILPILAMSLEKLGYLIESIPFYEEYFQINPEDAEYRYAYMRVLMHLRRYDLALKQIEILKKIRSLTSQEYIAWLEILFHLGEFSRVDYLANQWLSNQAVPLYYRLQIARLMALTNNRELLEYILNSLPDPSQRSILDNQQLIGVWSVLGEYSQALDFAQLLEKDLSKTPEGLMVLAHLYMQLSRAQDSLSYAEKALQLNPTYLPALDFIEQHEQRLSVIASLVELLKNKVNENPDYPTLRLDYAKNLIKFAIEEYLSGQLPSIYDSLELKQARLILEKLQGEMIELPERHLLLGRLYFLLGLFQEAKEQFQIALKLDPSYVEALQHIALVDEESGLKGSAISILKQAAKFAPNKGDVWEQLGGCFVAEKDWKNAVDAYQMSIRFSPFDPDAYLRLAEIYIKVKKPVDAVKTLEGLLAFSPENTEGLALMLKALYDPNYVKQDRDAELLQRNRIEYFDRLRLIDSERAKSALPEGVNLEPKGRK